MESFRGASSLRNPGKQLYLPPKSPFPSISAPVYGDHGSSGSREPPRLREGQRQHQRTSSESFLIDEQPLWLDDLLNEPETPVKRAGHRRSSSDSFAYLDGSRINSNFNNLAQECRHNSDNTITSTPLWGSLEFDIFKNVQPHFVVENTFDRPHDRVWMSGHNMGTYSSSLPFAKEKGMHPGSSGAADAKLGIESAKDSPGILEKKDASVSMYTQPETDPKRVKQRKIEGFHEIQLLLVINYHLVVSHKEEAVVESVDLALLDWLQMRCRWGEALSGFQRARGRQFAQRSRVRKLQYIAELERSVQTLQASYAAEGLEVSAELDFVDQQNLMLSLENKALKQRLDSLTQEQLIKHRVSA
ncbi:hypothetical protein KSP40_PGU005781 [Platanthera guangdongensis]|uniref:BZIP domain-containing protein n=1 Tax=Platanthera guangdongensis TaxID=2320717 RepID=A0ABR2M4H2_9ASPA